MYICRYIRLLVAGAGGLVADNICLWPHATHAVAAEPGPAVRDTTRTHQSRGTTGATSASASASGSAV